MFEFSVFFLQPLVLSKAGLSDFSYFLAEYWAGEYSDQAHKNQWPIYATAIQSQ
jgi:hypothetical protein